MDTVQHVAHGFIISAITEKIACHFEAGITLVAILYFANIFASLLPDLAGWLEKVHYNDKSRWNWYKSLHRIDFNNFLVFIPGGLLHIWLDSFCHADGKRWWIWNERLWLEILGWIVTLVVAYLIWR